MNNNPFLNDRLCILKFELNFWKKWSIHRKLAVRAEKQQVSASKGKFGNDAFPLNVEHSIQLKKIPKPNERSLYLQLCKYYSLSFFLSSLFWLFSLAGDMDISVLSKYISEQKRVYPAVEGRIIVRGSSSTTAHSFGLLLLALCLSLFLWSPSDVPNQQISWCHGQMRY